MKTKFIEISFGILSDNYHGPNCTRLRRTWQIVRMGSYAKHWTLYVYRCDAQAYMIGVRFPRWLGPWPKDQGTPR